MSFLLDTNFISETVRPRLDPGVVAWTRSHSPSDFYISVLSLGEVRKGVELRAAGARRDEFESWLTNVLPKQFMGRILPIDEEIAHVWGRLSAEGQKRGRVLPAVDGLIVATAIVHGLTLVTRNERDCAGRGAPVLNPWTG